MIRRFLYDQIYLDEHLSSEHADLDDCPDFRGRVGVYLCATSTFYAPSELAGSGGMHREIIPSTPTWYTEYERRDTVLIQDSSDDDPMGGMAVGRVMRILSVTYDGIRYPFVYVERYKVEGNAPDPLTGMWIVHPEMCRRRRSVALVHIDCVVRACHLIGVYGTTPVPLRFHFADSLDAFKAFYLNRFADYHSHECIPSV